MTRIPVALNKEQIRQSLTLAAKRANKPENNVWSDSNMSGHLMAVQSEMAFSHLSGLPMDKRILAGGDLGWDFHAGDHWIDVKVTKYDPPILKLHPQRDFGKRANLYVLAMMQNSGLIYFCGFSTRKFLLNYGYSKDFGHGPRECLDESRCGETSALIEDIARIRAMVPVAQ